MKKIIIFGFMGLLMAQGSALAKLDHWPIDPKQSTITFVGKSTFHQFEGQAGVMRGYLMRKAPGNVLQGHLEIDVLSLNTGIKARDNNMYAMFEAQRFSLIGFDIQKLGHPSLNSYHAMMQGILSIHGISHQLAIPVDVLINKDTYQCDGHFSVSLNAFKLRPPNVLGFIKVSDQIQVMFHVVFYQLL